MKGLSYGYDRRGRQTSITNGSVVCSLAYNDQNQAFSETYSGGPLDGISITNGYDGLLRRIQNVTLKSGMVLTATTNGFDAASRLSVVSDGTNSATYSYLANSLLASQITFAHNGTTTMTTSKSYDNLNRLTSIGSVNASSAVLDSHGYGYNSANQRTAVTNADGSYWLYQYDSLGQVISGVKHWNDGNVVAGQQFGYSFDDIGNRKAATSGGDEWGDHTRESDYLVNSQNQYTQRGIPGSVDIIGSATNTATVLVNGQAAYRRGDYYWMNLNINNGAGAVWQSVTNLGVLNRGTNADIIATNIGNVFLPGSTESFSYDADGNLTQDGRWTYAWDGENRLINMTSLSGGPTNSKLKLDFVYDYMGRRIEKTVSTNNGSAYYQSGQHLFVYDRWNLIDLLNSSFTPQTSFMWGLDLTGSKESAGGVGGLLTVTQYTPNNSQQFASFDCNGNVTVLIDAANGAITNQYEYGPFGEVVRGSGLAALENPFLFSTKYYDGESGIYYYGYRCYNANTGRWISRDPIGEDDSITLYGFVANNAVDYYDVLGLKKGDCVEGNIIFDPSLHAGGGWKVDAIDFIEGGTPGTPKQFDGYNVTFSASVAVKCICKTKCVVKHGTRKIKVAFDDQTDWFVGYEAGSSPIYISNPIQSVEKELIGLVKGAVSSNFPKGVALDPATITDIADNIKKRAPKSPHEGQWKGGDSPCDNAE